MADLWPGVPVNPQESPNILDVPAPTPAPAAEWPGVPVAAPNPPALTSEQMLTGNFGGAPTGPYTEPDRGILGNLGAGIASGVDTALNSGYMRSLHPSIATSVGETAGGLVGSMLNPVNIPSNLAAGEVGNAAVQAASPLLSGIARVAGPRTAAFAGHAISGAAGNAPFGTAEAVGQLSPEDVANHPVQSAVDVAKGTGAAALMGAGISGGLHALTGFKASTHASTEGLPPVAEAPTITPDVTPVPEAVAPSIEPKQKPRMRLQYDKVEGTPASNDAIVARADEIKAADPSIKYFDAKKQAAEELAGAGETRTRLVPSPVEAGSPEKTGQVYTAEEASKMVGNKGDSTGLLADTAKGDGTFVEATITPDMLDQTPHEIAAEDGIEGNKVKSFVEAPPEGGTPPILAVSSTNGGGKLTIADGRHRVLAAVARERLGMTDNAGVKALVPEAWARERGLIPEERGMGGVTHPAGIDIDTNIEHAMGASALASNPSLGNASWMGAGLSKAKAGWSALGQKIGAGKDLLGNIAGETFPTTSKLHRESAEAGVHVRAAGEYALARGTEAHEAMVRAAGGTRAEGKAVADKAWAALTEDNLRGLKDQKLAAGDVNGANAVKSMIGTAAPGLMTEAQYQATLKDPKVQAAIKAYGKFRPELEQKFQEGANNQNANLTNPVTRGKQTGVRINLLAKVDSTGNMVNQTARTGSGSQGGLRNPLNRKPRTNRSATGTAGAYNVSAKEGLQHSFREVTEPAAKREFTAALEKAGLAEIHRGYGDPVEGREAIRIEEARPARDKNGNAVVDKNGAPIMVQPLIMYPDPRIMSEVRRVYNLDRNYKIPVITKLLNTHTGASLIGLGEAIYHTGTLVSGVQRAFNLKGNAATNLFNSGLIRMGRSLAAVGKEAIDAYKKTPESLAMKSERARVGATRPDSGSKLPGALYIHGLHEAAAATIQRMVKEAQDLGKIPKTETALRDAITLNLGQYNKGLKGRITAALQESGAMPYLGTQKAQLGLLGRFYTGSTGVKGASPALRANHFANLVGTAMQIGAMSYLMSGRFFGREGVPLGDVDTGKDDKDGKPITIPTTFMFGLTPFKRSGGQTLTTGLRDGRDKGLISQDVFQDIVRNVTRLAGPGVKSGFSLATGKALDPALFDVNPSAPDGAIPFVENLKSTAAQVNSGATKAAARGVKALGFPDTAAEMGRYAGHPEDSILKSQVRALMPTGATIPNDKARIAAMRKENQKKRMREARKSNAE